MRSRIGRREFLKIGPGTALGMNLVVEGVQADAAGARLCVPDNCVHKFKKRRD
jgi:hypothetical protein